MTTHMVSIEIDEARLPRYTDGFLATCWHVAQANPQDGFASKGPGELAERIGREIIRRWLASTPPELHRHQGRHYFWKQLGTFAKYQPGGPAGTPEWDNGAWVPRDQHDTPPGGAS